jgi:hypothetical protein
MSIQDAKAAKAKLESEIGCLMAQFTKDTGFAISDIDIDEVFRFNSGEWKYFIKVRAEL